MKLGVIEYHIGARHKHDVRFLQPNIQKTKNEQSRLSSKHSPVVEAAAESNSTSRFSPPIAQVFKCPLCKNNVLESKLKEHNYECPKIERECFDCGVDVLSENLQDRLDKECQKRVVFCDACQGPVTYTQLGKHKSECPKIERKCSDCGANVVNQKIQNHQEEECQKRVVLCDACKSAMSYDELSDHDQECLEKSVVCDECEGEVLRKEKFKHAFECPMPLVRCENCEGVYAYSLEKEQREQCEKKKLACEYCELELKDLAGTACSGESLTLTANLTGEGATGQARVWMKALGVLPKTCDLDIVPPEDSGVVLFFLDAYLRPPVEQGGCLDSMAVFAPTVNGSFSEERLLATCVTGDLMEKVVVSRRPGATVRVELSVGTRDEVSVVGYHVKYSVFGTGHSLHYGLEMVGFFGAVGGIILVLLALDSFVRYLLEIWRLRQKQTWRTAVRKPTMTASENEYLTTVRATGSKSVNPLDRDLALFEEENGPDPSSRASQLDDAGEGSVRSEAPPSATAHRLPFSRKSSSKEPLSSRVFGASKNSLTPPLRDDATSKVYGDAERRDADNIFPMGSDIGFAKQTPEEPSEYPRVLLDDLDEDSPDEKVSVEDAYMSWDLAGSYKDLFEDSLASESLARFSTGDDDSGVPVRAARPVLSRQPSKGVEMTAHLLALKRSRNFTEGNNTISEGVLQWAYSSEERSSPGPSFSTGRSQDVEVIGFRSRWGKKALAALQRKRRMRNARQEL